MLFVLLKESELIEFLTVLFELIISSSNEREEEDPCPLKEGNDMVRVVVGGEGEG